LGLGFGGELAAGEGARGLTRSREGTDPVRARARAGLIHFFRARGGSASLWFCSVRMDGGVGRVDGGDAGYAFSSVYGGGPC
jgi:hypothetical protein